MGDENAFAEGIIVLITKKFAQPRTPPRTWHKQISKLSLKCVKALLGGRQRVFHDNSCHLSLSHFPGFLGI